MVQEKRKTYKNNDEEKYAEVNKKWEKVQRTERIDSILVGR